MQFYLRTMQRTVFLCIGGNLGEREANLEEALDFIDFNLGDVIAASAIYESEPWGMTDVPNFLNQVLQIQSELSDKELLEEIAELEEFFGRERSSEGYVSREMDIDVLFIDQEIIETETLRVPHPKMSERRFVLEPLAEIAPDFIHPELKKSIQELLASCADKGQVTRL
jgi:2-amino-4-hydroxy-6-hydroxymethyldihydropteridine diphosphokinase